MVRARRRGIGEPGGGGGGESERRRRGATKGNAGNAERRKLGTRRPQEVTVGEGEQARRSAAGQRGRRRRRRAGGREGRRGEGVPSPARRVHQPKERLSCRLRAIPC